MSDENKDLPFAFPSKFKNNSKYPIDHYGYEIDPGVTVSHHGMSLRDYFAAKAMQGFITNDGGFTLGDGNRERMESASQLFYKMADAMLKARGE